MLFWAETKLSRKILCIFCCFLMFVFLFVDFCHLLDNDRSQLLPQDVYLHLDKDLSLELFALMTFKLKFFKTVFFQLSLFSQLGHHVTQSH